MLKCRFIFNDISKTDFLCIEIWISKQFTRLHVEDVYREGSGDVRPHQRGSGQLAAQQEDGGPQDRGQQDGWGGDAQGNGARNLRCAGGRKAHRGRLHPAN